LGGLAGTIIKPEQKSGKRFTNKKFIVGIITGVIGAVAYYFLGINLLGLNLQGPFTEIAVFGVSALFAYLGIRITGA
jgi:small basic protein